jgi:hypothetical protein
MPTNLNLDCTRYLVIADFGANGLAAATDNIALTESEIISDILGGQYLPVNVIAFNPVEGWSRDVTEDIALAVLNTFEPGETIRRDVLEFIEARTDYLSLCPTSASERAEQEQLEVA